MMGSGPESGPFRNGPPGGLVFALSSRPSESHGLLGFVGDSGVWTSLCFSVARV